MLRYLVYKILKKYAGICVYFFYKKWQVDFREPVPEGPVLFVANHQNSFLDAIVLACSTKRDPWFLTRAGVFEKPFVKKILGLLRMSPVYRFRDGFSTLRKNDEMISNCVNLLEEGHAILIFGEGNHNDKFYLRPLQKGFARIAAAAEEKNHGKLKVKIVPVGLQYDSHTEFRSRVLVTFGKAITVHEIWDEAKNYQENLDAILSKTAQELKPLMLHIDPNHYDQKYVYFNANRIIKNDLIEQLKADQELIAHAPDTYSAKQKTDTTVSVNMNPIYWYERLNNLIPRSIIHWVLKNKVKDPQFIGSLKYAIGMLIVPISYTLQAALCYGLTGSSLISGIYFCSLPLMVWLKR
jgi:1-acyl-sn-glycerol-3-phosphate acyltransferase